MAGAYMKNAQVRLLTPSDGSVNTGTTVTLQAMILDPFLRLGAITFYLDRTAAYGSSYQQNSSNVNGDGWQEVSPISWVSAAMTIAGDWYWRARSDLVRVGAGPSIGTGRWATSFSFDEQAGQGVPRSLYLYEAITLPPILVAARSLYLYEAKVFAPYSVVARALYLYEAITLPPISVAARSLYAYGSWVDGEVFPYLNHISPTEQYIGGQVELYGDGFGQFLDAITPVAPIVTASSTNGTNVPSQAIDRTQAEWQSTSGAAAWIRFTWAGAKRIVAVFLEGSRNGTLWGIPQFRFDDASSQNGSVQVPAAEFDNSSELPVGHWREGYWLATPKVSTYLEIGIASGGSGTNRGFCEVWIVEEIEPAQNAETARAVLNLSLPAETTMGIVAWENRSPNFYPANGGVPPLPAGTVTVPVGAVSGLVQVEEST
jgi:hypothetical protein